ncbi:MAG: hypothetical protein HDS77_09310 [Bacteroidales bacterium]|nr:hypothetical protein [Bacteroidales bacterium]MBD5211436.1 hypothetical protein [Bacteroidales bacterium]
MKKKPSKLTLVIAIIMGIYFLYKGTGYISIPDFEVMGIAESACGVILIGLSVYWFLKKQKNEEE